MKNVLVLILSLFLCLAHLFGQNENPYEVFGYTAKYQYVMTKKAEGITLTNTDTKINIARLVLGLKSRRIFFFDENDSLLNIVTVPEDIFIRFISVDPLTGKYPELTPYQFASNRPIDGIDLDGLEYSASTTNGGFNQNARESVSNVSSPDPASYLHQKSLEFRQQQGSIKPGTTNFWTFVNQYTQFLKKVNPALGSLQELEYKIMDDVYITYTNIKYGRGYARHLDPTQGTTNYKETISAGLNTTSLILGGVQAGGEKLLFSSFAEEAMASTSVASGSQYSVAYETNLSSNLYPGKGYSTHFKAANAALDKAIASDATFANSMSELGISVPRSPSGTVLGKSPTNWVWHHDFNVGVLQLVPKAQHTTGSLFWNTMHPGGMGGMAIWGK